MERASPEDPAAYGSFRDDLEVRVPDPAPLPPEGCPTAARRGSSGRGRLSRLSPSRRRADGALVVALVVRVSIVALLLAWSSLAAGDPCRLETPEAARRALRLVEPHALIVSYCWWCDSPTPLPLRVTRVGLERAEPDRVRVIEWSGPEPREREFPLAALVQAERHGRGPLAAFLRQDIERSTDTSGYLGPDDPYLVQEKRAQFSMRLQHVREDHDLRTWDELVVNGESVDPRLLYVPASPAGGPSFRSLGHAVGCSMGNAPPTVDFRPVVRDPSKAAPPRPFVADVTDQCYDGACPQPTWRALDATPLFTAASEDATRVGELASGEEVVPVETQVHVIGSRAVVLRDHDRFFEGDVFYLLDSQAEGFFRLWHYGDVFVLDASDVDTGAGWMPCREQPHGCWARAEGGALELWWARVRRGDGSEVWVRDPLRYLDGVLRSD